MDRRSALAALTAAGTAGLAGCSALFGAEETSTPTDTETTTPTSTPTPTLSFDAGPTTFRAADDRRAFLPDAVAPESPLETRWEIQVPHQFYHPVVGGDTLYLVNSFYIDAPNVQAFDVASGERRWTTVLEAGLGPMTLDDGTAFVQSSEGVFALDAATGDREWKADGETEFPTAVAVADGHVLAASDERGLVALDRESGERAWGADLGKATTAPAVDGDRVAVKHNDATTFVADVFDVATGEFLDRASGLGSGLDPVAPDGDAVFVSGGGSMRRHTLGERLPDWRVSPIDLTGPAAVAEDLVVGATAESVVAVDRASGERAWTTETDVELTSTPVVGGETVYVGGRTDDGGAVLALDLATGDRQFDLATSKPVGRLPGAVDGGVVVHTSNNVGGEDPEYLSLVLGG